MKQRCCFSTTIWLFCINFDHVPEKFNLHFASLVTKIGADWHGINNSLSKTTEDGDSRQNSQPTIQAVQQTWNKADFLRNCKDENEEPADLGCLIVVSGTCQPSLHQQPEMCEILYKRCRDGLTKILNLLMCLHRPLHTSATDQELPQTTLPNSEIAQKGFTYHCFPFDGSWKRLWSITDTNCLK